MVHRFFHFPVEWFMGLALALTACTPSQETTLPTVIPTQTTLPASTPTFAPTSTPTPAPAAQEAWSIFANQGWQNPHTLFVHPGDTLDITATGAWSHEPGNPQFSTLYGPGGVDRFDAGTTLPSAPTGSLLGRIGDGPLFVIGEHLVLTSTYRGKLWLSMNDNPDLLSDNTGSVGVTVRLTPKPAAPGIRLTNLPDHYRLVYPAEYYAVITENGLCLTPSNAAAGACDISYIATLEISDADGRTVEQIAETIVPKNDPNYQVDSRPITIDGEQAVLLDVIVTGDSWRMVVIVYRDRVYKWKFTPWFLPPGMAEQFLQMERFYDTVTNSFQFLD